jgi:two-component system OmpR family response regulator
MPKILIVEDDASLRDLVSNNLGFEGHLVVATGDGNHALALHAAQPADLVVLDLMLPGRDGFQVLKALRDGGDTVPVILLTARSAEADRIMGLRGGADDYVVKPFSVVELVARIEAILRRTKGTSSRALASGPFLIHRNRKQVYLANRSLGLTALEFQVVEALTAHPGVPLTREELIRLVWGDAEPSAQRTLNVHMANLRRKLAEAGPEEWIVTVGRAGRGGYQWSSPVEPAPEP